MLGIMFRIPMKFHAIATGEAARPPWVSWRALERESTRAGLLRAPRQSRGDELIPHKGGAHAVVSIGKTVLASAALETSTLVLDYFGYYGRLRSDNYTQISRKNFSGRTHRRQINQKVLDKFFANKPRDKELSCLAEIV